jgi:hypothetical protein
MRKGGNARNGAWNRIADSTMNPDESLAAVQAALA